MPQGTPTPPDVILKAIRLVVEEHYNYTQAGKVTGISHTTVRRAVLLANGQNRSRQGLPSRTAPEDKVREAIRLVREERLGYVEVARIAGLSPHTVRNYVIANGAQSPHRRNIPDRDFHQAQALIDAGATLVAAAKQLDMSDYTLRNWRKKHGYPQLRSTGRPPANSLATRVANLLTHGPRPMDDVYHAVIDTITPARAIRAAERDRTRQVGDNPRTKTRSIEQIIEIGKRVLFRELVLAKPQAHRFTAEDGTQMLEWLPKSRTR